MGLIQTPDQLRFSYIAILQGATNSTEDDDSESEEIEEEGKKTKSRYREINLIAVYALMLVIISKMKSYVMFETKVQIFKCFSPSCHPKYNLDMKICLKFNVGYSRSSFVIC